MDHFTKTKMACQEHRRGRMSSWSNHTWTVVGVDSSPMEEYYMVATRNSLALNHDIQEEQVVPNATIISVIPIAGISFIFYSIAC